MMMVIGGPSKGGDEKPSFGGKGEKDDESDGGSMLTGMGRKKATKDVVRALGLDPADVDIGALDKALEAHYSACEGAETDEEE